MSTEPDGSSDEPAAAAEPELPVEAEPPVEAEAPDGGTQQSVIQLTKAEYIAQANAICTAATDRFLAAVEEEGGTLNAGGPFVDADEMGWSELWVRFSEELLAELIALPLPEADLARLNEAYLLVERKTNLHRQLGTAESAGDTGATGSCSPSATPCRIRYTWPFPPTA